MKLEQINKLTKLNLKSSDKIVFKQKENPLSNSEKERINSFWNKFSKGKTHFFNGEILAIQSVENSESETIINWYKSNFAHYLIEDKNIEKAKIIYCSVLVFTEENKLLVVKTSNKTVTNGKLMLPGGNIELEKNKLDIEICKKNAVRELNEEIGIELSTENIEFWKIKTGGKDGEVGLFFKSKIQFNEENIKEIFRNNNDDEIDEIYFVQDIEEMNKIENDGFVDYMEEMMKYA